MYFIWRCWFLKFWIVPSKRLYHGWGGGGLVRSTPSNGPRNGYCPHQNHYFPRHINNMYFNSYNHTRRRHSNNIWFLKLLIFLPTLFTWVVCRHLRRFPKGGGVYTKTCEGLGESQFGRLEKKLSTLRNIFHQRRQIRLSFLVITNDHHMFIVSSRRSAPVVIF